MNISIIFIVAIGLYGFINGSNHRIQGNSSDIAININNQCTEPTQQPYNGIPLENGFLKKIKNIAWYDTMATQWKKYRVSFFLLAVVSGYGYLWYQLHNARNLFDNARAWSCWKNHITVDHLSSYSRDELSKELFIDIQERYINIDDPTDHLLPLAGFLPMLERERVLLEKYIWWGSKIMTCRMHLIFPLNKENINQAEEGLKRLKFIKGLFISWWAVHNSQHKMP